MIKMSSIQFICKDFLEKSAEVDDDSILPGLASAAGSVAAFSQAGKPFLKNIIDDPNIEDMIIGEKPTNSRVNNFHKIKRGIHRLPNTHVITSILKKLYPPHEVGMMPEEQIHKAIPRINEVNKGIADILNKEGYGHDISLEKFIDDGSEYFINGSRDKSKYKDTILSIHPTHEFQGVNNASIGLSEGGIFGKNRVRGKLHLGIQHGDDFSVGTAAHELGHLKEYSRKDFRGKLQEHYYGKFGKPMRLANRAALGAGVTLAGTNALKSITGMSENTKDNIDLGLAGVGAALGTGSMAHEIMASYTGTKMLPKRPIKTHLKNIKDTWSGVPSYSKYMATPLLAYGAKKAIEGITGDK